MLFFTKSEEMSRVGSRDRHAWWRSKNTIQSKVVGEMLLMITIKYDLEIDRYIYQRRVILVALFKKSARLLSPPTTHPAGSSYHEWLADL